MSPRRKTTHPHPDHVRRFERAQPNQLWQTDLFTFVLKRQNRRVYLVAFLDDHSRFVSGYGLHASQATALVLEVLRAAIYGPPERIPCLPTGRSRTTATSMSPGGARVPSPKSWRNGASGRSWHFRDDSPGAACGISLPKARSTRTPSTR